MRPDYFTGYSWADEERRHREIGEAGTTIAQYTDGSRDDTLTEEDTRIIEEAWWKYNRYSEGHQYYQAETDETGVAIGTHPIDPVAQGYWFCPVRETTRSIYAEEPSVEITSIPYAKTPMEAIAEAKRSGLNTLFSDHENLLRLEVLLSGQLKFEGQRRPRWFPVQYTTDQESEDLDREVREFLQGEGYEVTE